MSKRTIIVVCNRTLNLGGIETSLVRLLKLLSADCNNRITLVLGDENGGLFQQIPAEIHIILHPYEKATSGFLKDAKRLRIGRVARGAFYRVLVRTARHFYKKLKCWYKIAEPYIEIPGSYDCAIAFSTDYSDLSIVLDKVAAHKKAAFLHSDPSRDVVSAKMNDRLLRRFDKVYCVSERVKQLFYEVHPACAGKAEVFYNIVDSSEIREKAKEKYDCPYLRDSVNILTVGRLSQEKGQDMIPETTKELIDRGYQVKWYIIGDGPLYTEINNSIQALRLIGQVVLLGKKDNPYSYIKDCDIYVQTSRSEAYCMTVQEARILAKPIVTTDFPGSDEQIKDGYSGIITKADSKAIADGIERYLRSTELRASVTAHLAGTDCGNTDNIRALYKWIEE